MARTVRARQLAVGLFDVLWAGIDGHTKDFGSFDGRVAKGSTQLAPHLLPSLVLLAHPHRLRWSDTHTHTREAVGVAAAMAEARRRSRRGGEGLGGVVAVVPRVLSSPEKAPNCFQPNLMASGPLYVVVLPVTSSVVVNEPFR